MIIPSALSISLLTLTFIFSPTLASPVLDHSEPKSALFRILLPRACEYNTTCQSRGIPKGLFCGDGAFGCVRGEVYQSDGNDGVCRYPGGRTDCVACRVLCCGDGCD
ncbi:hypothetical protein BKA62DRAFT_697793 [Auriculariales sp. MPI-PUGE-AT-0066]|nr:hypothetical protein BKA62DRAFT_697793 [Auriculariales sp. MPI-PUGE-AT-0066]